MNDFYKYTDLTNKMINQFANSANTELLKNLSSQEALLRSFSSYWENILDSHSLTVAKSLGDAFNNANLYTNTFNPALSSLIENMQNLISSVPDIERTALKNASVISMSEKIEKTLLNATYSNSVLSDIKTIADNCMNEGLPSEIDPTYNNDLVELTDGKSSIKITTFVRDILMGVLVNVFANILVMLISSRLGFSEPQPARSTEAETHIQVTNINQVNINFDNLDMFVYSLSSPDPETQIIIDNFQSSYAALKEYLSQSETILPESEFDSHTSSDTHFDEPGYDKPNISTGKAASEE